MLACGYMLAALPDWLPLGRDCVQRYREHRKLPVFSHDELLVSVITLDDTADSFINTFKHTIWQCFTRSKWQLPSLPSLLILHITSLHILNSTSIKILNNIVSKFLCRYVASIDLRAAYGYEVKEESDFYIKLVHSAMEPLHPVIHATRSSLVDFVPSLKFIPCAYKLRFLHQNFYSVTYG